MSETQRVEKVCRKCGESKTVGDFPRNLRMADGLSSWCRSCHVAATQRWRAANRERLNEARRVVPAWVKIDGVIVANPSPRPKSKVW